MKAIDIALKDLTRAFRSATAVVFMFVIPLLVTGMFYLMFGRIASEGGFNLPRVKLMIANLDEGGPKMQAGSENIPGCSRVNSLGELIVCVLRSEDLADLVEISDAPDAASARAAVDSQQVHVALIIPADFSRQFADLYGKAAVEIYEDPTLTIGPGIVKSIMNQFMDQVSGIKIAMDVALGQTDQPDFALVGQVIQEYLASSNTQSEDLAEVLLDVRAPVKSQKEEEVNPLVQIVGPIMGGMMIFYAFFTGTSTAQSILREEEERTLPRLFTTPTPQSTILTGKFLSVFLTVLVQVVVLLIVAHLVFQIEWGDWTSVAVVAAGIVFSASSFGIFVNSFLKDMKQAGGIFGGVLTVTGMIGMIGVFVGGSQSGASFANTVPLLVPQGWAVRGLVQTMNGEALLSVLPSSLVLLGWSTVFFITGILRFNRRYV